MHDHLSILIFFSKSKARCTFWGPYLTLVSGDFGPRLFRQTVILDDDFGRCALNSDAAENMDSDFGRCALNSDAQLSSLLYHYFRTKIAKFGW